MRWSIPLILLACSVQAGSLFLLPDRWQDARHEMMRIITGSSKTYWIVADEFDDRTMERLVKKLSDRQLVLMTVSAQTASRFAIFRHAEVCILKHPVGFSLVQNDLNEVCTTTAMITDSLSRHRGVVTCLKDRDSGYVVKTLLKRCRPYLTAVSP